MIGDQNHSNVVATWRRRDLMLTRRGWRCADCGRTTLVRRLACPGCGATAEAERVPLARRGTVRAISSAGAGLERLDQTTSRRVVALLELEGGQNIACLVAHADTVTLTSALRGQTLRLAVRRIPLGPLAEDEPIPYGLKATLDLSTRQVLKSRTETEDDKDS